MRLVKVVRARDGLAAVTFFKAPDGFYGVEGEAVYGNDGETRWVPTGILGPYATLQAAERTALSTGTWQRQNERARIRSVRTILRGYRLLGIRRLLGIP